VRHDRSASAFVFSMDAEPLLTLPRIARAFVRECTTMLDATANEVVLLLTSEVVSNSIQHARTSRVQVSLERIGSSLRVAVVDEDPVLPVLRERDDTRIGGLGLQMVAKMAEAWGVDVDGDAGKRVWFDVQTA
jgi:signal transduction histidine kinase